MSDARELKKRKQDIQVYQQQYEKSVCKCNHQKSNGKFKIHVIRSGIVRCRYCDDTFSIVPVSEKDMNFAEDTYLNMLNQLKLFSNRGEMDAAIIDKLANLMYDIKRIRKLYIRNLETFNVTKKKKSRNNNDNRAYGAVGMGNMNFNRPR
jgi:hypothetical protein